MYVHTGNGLRGFELKRCKKVVASANFVLFVMEAKENGNIAVCVHNAREQVKAGVVTCVP